MSREGSLAKQTIILAIGTFFPKMAIFIALPILTAYLSKAEYGTYDLVVTLVSLVLPAATLQVQAAAFRYLLDAKENPEEKENIISNIYAFVTITSLIVLSIGFFLMRGQSVVIRIAICAYYFLDIYSLVSKQLVRGLFRNVDYSISAIISGLGQIIFIVLLVMGLKKGLLGGIVALALAELLATLYLFLKARIYRYIKLEKLNTQTIKAMLGYSWPMVPNSLSQWVIHASDRLIITYFMGITANAVYSVAYKIPSILSLAQTTFNMAWQENASINANDEDACAYYSSMFTWLYNIVAGMMSVLIGFTPLLFVLFVKGDYSQAYNQIPILFMGMFFLCLSTFWGGIFVAIKQTKAVGTTTVIAAIIHLSINLTMIKHFGLYAASVACVIAYSSMCVLRALAIRRYVSIDYNIKNVVLVLTVLVVQCILCFMQSTVCNIANFILGPIVMLVLNRKLIKNVYTIMCKKLLKRK